MIPSVRALALLGVVSLLSVAGFVTPALGVMALAFDALVLVLVVVDARSSGRQELRVERWVAETAHQGERLVLTLDVEVPGPRAVRVRLREVLHPVLTEEPVDLEATVPARSRASLPYELRPRLRGRGDLEPVAVRVLGPWGLAWTARTVAPGQQVKVYPRAHLEGDAGLVVRHALRQRAGANQRERRGLSSELYALREYQRGDSMRQIHWKASARRNRPVARETCWEQHQHLVVLVDCGRPMASLAEGMSKLDHALAAVLAMTRVTLSQNDAATLVLFSKEIRQVVRVDRRVRAFGAVFEQVFEEQADLDEPDYDAAAAWCLRRVPRRSLVLVCTSVLDALGAERMGASLARLAVRHRPVLVNLEDPALADHARSIPEDVGGAYSKTSALAMYARIEGLSRQLRQQGVDVITMPASRLAIGMIDRYLAFKERRGL